MENSNNIKELKTLAEDTLITIQPHMNKGHKNRFEAPSLDFEGYTDLLTTIDALIKVCLLATQGDQHVPPFIKSPSQNIRITLELVSKLMPFEEGEFLDKAYTLLLMDSEDG